MHLIILLKDWDWIQLANVHKLVAKHGIQAVKVVPWVNGVAGARERVVAELAKLRNGDKIHVVSHGSENAFGVGITPLELADLIDEGLRPNTSVKIRVDSCKSAVPNADGDNTALTICNRLSLKHRTGISVSGTTGNSVTGAEGKRIVVPAAILNEASAKQEELEVAHLEKIARTGALVEGITCASTDAEIKTNAALIHVYTKPFFDDFVAWFKGDAAREVSRENKAHKNSYSTSA